jgi:CHASE2 domain-containing sensor protein
VRAKSLIKSLLIALALTAATLTLGRFPTFESMEKRLLDAAFILRGPEPVDPDVVIVEIDDKSLAAVGTWPWPRSYHAALLKALGKTKPSIIFYDIVFPESSVREEDETFAEEIRKAGNVILPFYFPASSPDHFWESPEVFPIPAFKAAAKSLAYINHFRDPDGHAREFILRIPGHPGLDLHSSLATAANYRGNAREFSKLFQPARAVLINFPGPYENLHRISFIDLMDPSGGPQLLKALEHRAVLVGLTASGTTDLIPTVYSPVYPGVGIQASMVHTLLTQKFIWKIPVLFYGFLAFVFVLLPLWLSEKFHPLKSLSYIGAFWIMLLAGMQIAFQYYGYWIPAGGILIVSFSTYLTVQLIQFVKTRFDRELILKELSLAADIQRSFLPPPPSNIKGLEIAAVNLPAKQVGGDLYDFQVFEDGLVSVCVGDVSGKGAPAALFMAKSISEFRREARLKSPGKVLAALNNKICEDGTSGLFLTLLHLVVNPETKSFTFASGGHEAIYCYRQKDRSVELLNTSAGLPLGVMAENPYEEKEAQCEAGDTLLLISDGVKEAMNSRREIFGIKRIQETLAATAQRDPQGILTYCRKRIEEFVKDAPQHDDLTMVCIKF